MFTGLIEAVGEVIEIKRLSSGGLLKIHPLKKDIFQNCNIGDSIAINGVCLTVVKKEKDSLVFDISEETFNRTNLKFLKRKDLVNIETSLTLNKPLGGHIVYGHVDTIGRIKKIIPKGSHKILIIEIQPEYQKFLIEKGSIAVDGISLTINKVERREIHINIIPHTYENTNLKQRRIGDYVNLEFDMIAKLVFKQVAEIIKNWKKY
jgi:riboflavin synthase